MVCGGHFDVVEDLLWEPDSAEFLVSVAADQTSRLHAPWTPPGFFVVVLTEFLSEFSWL